MLWKYSKLVKAQKIHKLLKDKTKYEDATIQNTDVFANERKKGEGNKLQATPSCKQLQYTATAHNN